MPIGKSRLIAVVCLVLALVGQSVAAARVSCSMMNSGSPVIDTTLDDHHSMSAMDHSHHAMPVALDEKNTMECCGDEACSMAHCLSTLSMLVASDYKGPAGATGAFQPDQLAAYISTPPSSHYRPPNSR